MLTKSSLLEFNSDRHEYLYNGEKCISVTQLVKKYSKPFEAEEHAARIAMNTGRTRQEVLNEWKHKATTASDQGDYVHSRAEKIAGFINSHGYIEIPRIESNDYKNKVRQLARWYHDHVEMCYGDLYSEFRVVYPEFLIAGTIDLYSTGYNGVPALIDFKTNKEIDIYGYNNMLAPFQRGKLKLRDSNFWTYALQLNMYRRILNDKYGQEVDKMVLVHFEAGDHYTEYDVPLLDDHISAILKERNPDEYEISTSSVG